MKNATYETWLGYFRYYTKIGLCFNMSRQWINETTEASQARLTWSPSEAPVPIFQYEAVEKAPTRGGSAPDILEFQLHSCIYINQLGIEFDITSPAPFISPLSCVFFCQISIQLKSRCNSVKAAGLINPDGVAAKIKISKSEATVTPRSTFRVKRVFNIQRVTRGIWNN